MLYAVVDIDTKAIIQYSDLNAADADAYSYSNPGYKLIQANEVKPPDSVHYDDAAEEVLERPVKPHSYVTWDDTAKAWVDNIQLAKESLNQVVIDKYKSICQGVDPETDSRIYVNCSVGNTIYKMDAGQEAATNMDAGVRIFELSGADYMPIVRDFNNTNHTNVPIADARSIALQQGAYALTLWQQKGAKIDAIAGAESVSDLLSLDLSFEVNV